MIKLFFYLHLVGIAVLLGGIAVYLYPDNNPQTTASMVGVAFAIGLGLFLISPYPVVKAFQWMIKESESKLND